MRDVNKIILTGNLGTDPDLRHTANGNAVTSFRIAVHGIQEKDGTDWFTIIAWGKLAEICNQYLSKGKKIYVDGRIHNRAWESPDKQIHYRTEITADDIIFLSRDTDDESAKVVDLNPNESNISDKEGSEASQ